MSFGHTPGIFHGGLVMEQPASRKLPAHCLSTTVSQYSWSPGQLKVQEKRSPIPPGHCLLSRTWSGSPDQPQCKQELTTFDRYTDVSVLPGAVISLRFSPAWLCPLLFSRVRKVLDGDWEGIVSLRTCLFLLHSVKM